MRRWVAMVVGIAALVGCSGGSGSDAGTGSDGGGPNSCGALQEVPMIGTFTSNQAQGTVVDAGVFFQECVGAPFPWELLEGNQGIDCPEIIDFTRPSNVVQRQDILSVTLALQNPPAVGTYSSSSLQTCGGVAVSLFLGGQNAMVWENAGAGDCLLGGAGTARGTWTLNLSSVSPYDAGNGGVYYQMHGSLTGTMVPAPQLNNEADGGMTVDMTF